MERPAGFMVADVPDTRRASCPGKPQADIVRGVDLDLCNGGYTQTKDAAVFMKSPSKQAKEKRKSLQEQPAIPRSLTDVDVLKPHHEEPTTSGESDDEHDEHDPKAYGGDDGSHDEKEPQAKECGTLPTTSEEIAPVSSDSGNCAGEDQRGSNRSFRRGSTQSTVFRPSEERSSSDSEDSDDDSDEEASDEQEDGIEWDSQASFQRGVQKRASEQVRMLQLKSLASRQKLRFSDPACDAATRMLQRQQVGEEAVKFTEKYAATMNIMQEHMTLEPPSRRRHSVEVSELAAYHVPMPDPEEAMATRPMSAMQD